MALMTGGATRESGTSSVGQWAVTVKRHRGDRRALRIRLRF